MERSEPGQRTAGAAAPGLPQARPLYGSVAEITSPDFFQRETGRVVRSVSIEVVNAGFAHSGSELSRVTVGFGDGGAGRYILKRLNPSWDWLMQATDDTRCRSVTLWTEGILDQLPAQIDTTTVACATDGQGWAILMRDAGDTLVTNRRFTEQQNRDFVDALGALHARFLASPPTDTTPSGAGSSPLTPGLCTITDVYRMFAPTTAERFFSEESGKEIHQRIREGWDAVAELMPRDVAEATLALVEDPGPLVRALRRYPHTLVHGDYRHSNLGWQPGSTILLDWQLATWGPPAIDLGRYIGANSPFLPVPKGRLLADYRGAFVRYLEGRDSETAAETETGGASGTAVAAGIPPLAQWCDDQLALGLLGGFIQDGWAIVLKATTWDITADTREHWKSDLAWWSDVVRRGVEFL